MPLNLDQISTWVAVKDKRLCPDCQNLAGKTMTVGEWIASGVLPGNGHTMCGEWCRCMILPQKWADSFGEEKTATTSIDGVKELLSTEGPIENLDPSLSARWEVLLERESGFSTSVEQDIYLTLKYYNQDPMGLKAKYPRHYELLIRLIGA